MSPWPLLLSSLLLAATARAADVHAEWELKAGSVSPDGFARSASLVNGVFPGPLLKANKGDTVTVNVKNNLHDDSMRKSASIHWHGIFQPRNAHNDGPSFVTQCPIAPDNEYQYSLKLGDQAGTFWYHSHLSTQYVDGVRGVIVIYDPNDPQKLLYDVDDESTIITLADWYHTAAPALSANWLSGAPEPTPDTGLINGAGRFESGPAVERARINVEKGKRYRLRVVGLAARGQFEFSIAGHRMTVIEADGVAHEPYVVDSIPILTGQRYSVVIEANQTVDNYWISATQTVLGSTTQPDNPNFNGTDTFAVLHYAGAPDAEPTAPQPTGLVSGGVEFEEFNLKPLQNPGSPGGAAPADKVFNFNFTFGAPNGDVWTVNGVQYQSPTVPTLLNILSNGFVNDSQFGTNENTFTFPPNSVVEIAFIGGAGHSFHLHGHAFDVIQSASGPVNFVNPPRRDVVASGDSPVRVRFRTDNPGPWFVHCHIDWHLDTGLAAVFAEDTAGMKSGPKSIQPDPAWQKLCEIYDALPDSDK